MKLLSASLILIILFFATYAVFLFTQPVSIRDVIIEINSGESAFSIAKKLHQNGIIRSRNIFYLYVKLAGIDDQLSFGKYLFYGNMSLISVAKKLRLGKVVQNKITFPEGYTLKRICRKLSNKKFGDYRKFLEICHDSLFILKTTGFDKPSLEGFLYPETYYFPDDVNEEFIIKHLITEFFKQTENLDFKPTPKLDFYDQIVLASIVEREAKIEDEKPLIASVYLNRIEYNHKLQADPTIAYALELKGMTRKKIFYKDLEIDSPYNTYKNYGLPPTPICNPSRSSIEAVLNPATTDYFYFVADKKGRHLFSQTYNQHLNYQYEMKRNNGK